MSDRLFRRGRTWYAWVYVDGKQVKQSTGCTDKDAARKVLAQLERRAADPDGTAKAEAKLQDAFDALYDATWARAMAKAPTRSEDTIKFQRKQAKGWLLYAGMVASKAVADPATLTTERRTELRKAGESFPLARVTAGFVDGFIAWRRASTVVGEGTIGKDLAVARPAMRLMLRAGKWEGSIEKCFPRHELLYEPGDRWLPLDELRMLLPKLEAHRAAVVAFAYALGAEPRAIARALRADIADETSTMVHVRGTKKKTRDRWVPILFDWQRELLTFVREHADGTGGHLFGKWSNQRRVLAEACDRAEISHASLTAMRHSFAHMCKDGGIAQEHLAPMMGHVDTSMLDRIYARPSTKEELLRLAQADVHARRVAMLTVIPGGKTDAKSA